MNFREWLEAKSLVKTVFTKDGGKEVAKIHSDVLKSHFGKTGRPVRSKIREIILGWEVWFLNEHEDLEEIDFLKRIEKYKLQIHRVLAGLQSIGVRKSNRVPIIIHFGDRGAYGAAAGDYRASTFGRIDPESSKNATNTLRGLPKTKSSYSQFKNVKDSSVIHIYKTADLANLPVTLAHEIAHSIYNGLSNSQKEEIKRLANSTASPSNYGRPDYNSSESHVSGNEWFAEMIAKIIIYSKQGYDLDHGPDDDTWGNYIDMAVKVKDILSGAWITQSNYPDFKNWTSKTLGNIQNMAGHNQHPSPSDSFRKDKNVKVPKRLRGKFSVDDSGRLR